jgi:hypothetical protein
LIFYPAMPPQPPHAHQIHIEVPGTLHDQLANVSAQPHMAG